MELEDFKNLFDSFLFSLNFLFNNVIVYIWQRNGKMMCFIFVLFVVKFYGEIKFEILYVVVFFEFFYMVSLVYDDVVDESIECCGQLLVNVIFNNKVVVLVGDFFLVISLVYVECICNYDIIGVVVCLG